jgi:hypothetical protein
VYKHTSINILEVNFPHALVFLPTRLDYLGVESDVFFRIIFDRNMLEVLPNFTPRRIVLRPIWVGLKRRLVRMRRTTSD